MKITVIFIFTCLVSVLGVFAQTNGEKIKTDARKAVEDCLKHYFAAGDNSDADKLGKAFHPAAMMFWIDADGGLNHLTQLKWKATLRSNKNPQKALKRDIQIVDCVADACVAKIVSTYADKIYYDYMALMKAENEWKIVAKVFYKTEPQAKLADNSAAEKREIESLLQTKFKSMDLNDPDLLASVYHPRTMSYYTDENRLVGVSIGEWIARFDYDRRKNSPIPKAERKILFTDVTGNVGYSRFTHEFAETLVTDYTLLVKQNNRWRVINLLFTSEKK